MQGLDEKTRSALLLYLADLRSLPNETAKTQRFSALIGEIFPRTSASTHFAAGAEKVVRIETPQGPRRRRIDSYYGSAVIEFENSLEATGEEAERQLREQVSGIWNKEGGSPRPLSAIASDGIVWKIYRPRLRAGARRPTPEDVELGQPLREISLSAESLGDFWLWLTSLLFRGEHEVTADQFRNDFGQTSFAYHDAMEYLRKAWAAVRESSESRLAFQTWQRYLTVTYGRLSESLGNGGGNGSSITEIEDLFLKHTYLASVARLLIWASVSRGRAKGSLRQIAAAVLSGSFFQQHNFANLVEDDFFHWVRGLQAEAILAPVWERIIDSLLTYDLLHLDEDVFKGVYQELVDPRDRHDLGEYYTPDWLCERIIEEILPRSGFPSVLDPTCGSGSFLRATIRHLLRANPSGSDAERLHGVLQHVVGIDIHPLAVTIARATYLLALGPLAKAAKRPIQIPVYLADSLFLPTEVEQHELEEAPQIQIKFGGREVKIPESLVAASDLFDSAIAASTKVALDHAASRKESMQTLTAFLKREVPELARRKDAESVFSALWRFSEQLAELIREKENSIWAFIVRNSYRPAMLRGSFDFIAGNPPWLSYRYIADPEYQEEVKKRAVKQYAIAPGSQKLFTQMELATVFLAHCINTFGRDGARIAFVMPRSVLSADQHANLRARLYRARFDLTAYWDLLEVRPLFNVPACVLFARRGNLMGSTPQSLPAWEWRGRLPEKDLPWGKASVHLSYAEKTARVIYLGKRNAFSTEPGRARPRASSSYARRFHQGATILPRNFYFVAVKDLNGAPDPEKLYWAETDPAQAEDAKPPYKDVRMQGQVQGRFLYYVALSRHLLPFALLEPSVAVVPVESSGATLRVRTAVDLRADGYREFAKWMEQAEQIWTTCRKDKAARQDLYEWLDYQGKLTVQNLKSRYLLLYNAAGTNLSAAAVDRESLSLPFLVEHKLYWCSCASQAEADYLASILNSSVANEAIKPFQSMGLMGQRDIEKKVMDLRFPEFDKDLPPHRALADLGARARKDAARLVSRTKLPRSLGPRRAFIRTQLKSALAEIDKIVKTLI